MFLRLGPGQAHPATYYSGTVLDQSRGIPRSAGLPGGSPASPYLHGGQARPCSCSGSTNSLDIRARGLRLVVPWTGHRRSRASSYQKTKARHRWLRCTLEAPPAPGQPWFQWPKGDHPSKSRMKQVFLILGNRGYGVGYEMDNTNAGALPSGNGTLIPCRVARGIKEQKGKIHLSRGAGLGLPAEGRQFLLR